MKKILKGWVGNDFKAKDMLHWTGEELNKMLFLGNIFYIKGNKNQWDEESNWPPKRVIVTVEVKDE